jgi:hypothetical protein
MDITKILEDLRQEKAQLEEAILSLERLAAGGKRRGRPPAWMAAVKERGPGRQAGNNHNNINSNTKKVKSKDLSSEAPENI